jgi:hypothetical protein
MIGSSFYALKAVGVGMVSRAVMRILVMEGWESDL